MRKSRGRGHKRSSYIRVYHQAQANETSTQYRNKGDLIMKLFLNKKEKLELYYMDTVLKIAKSNKLNDEQKSKGISTYMEMALYQLLKEDK